MSEFIDWNEAWDTGIAAIDGDHRQMAAMLNRLLQSLPQSGTDFDAVPDLDELLDDLISLTREHFHSEEQHMRQAGFPGLAAHRREHAILVAELREYVDDIRRGRLNADIRTRRALWHWFIAHMVLSDKEFARFYHSLE